MIFYSDVARDFAEDVYVRLTTMVVYKGTQPSVQDYISKVNDGTYTQAGNYLLQAYKDVDLAVNKIESTYRINKNSPDGTSYGNYIGQSGTAEWAVLFDLSMLTGTNKLLEFSSATGLNFLRNLTENDLFMIVPVSDAAGAGVLRFDTINFTGFNNPVKKFTLNFS